MPPRIIVGRAVSPLAGHSDMYAFLRRPSWLMLHVVVLAIIVAFLLLGRWQLERLDQRRAENAVIAAHLAASPVEWSKTSSGRPPEYSRLLIAGAFAPDEEVLLRSQVNQGQPGFDVLTPLYVDEIAAVVVNRGWVPLEFDAPPVAQALPPADVVTVEGIVRYPLTGSNLATTAGAVGKLDIVARVDLERLDGQIGGDLATFYVELTSLSPPGTSQPIPAGIPEVSEGSHLSYAVQWFSFALVSTIGYAALIRSTARRRAGLRRRAGSPPLAPS
ncbi:MAG: SURF1 family protein [Acidimicrobiia bacterium]|nr:SURF1 family protein [Acidimicrobiia bacterium]